MNFRTYMSNQALIAILIILIGLIVTGVVASCAPAPDQGAVERVYNAETPMIVTNMISDRDGFRSFTRYYDSEYNVACYVKTVNESMQCVFLGDK